MSTTMLANNQLYSQQHLNNEDSMFSIVDQSKSPAIQNLFSNQLNLQKAPSEKKTRNGKIGKNRRHTLDNSQPRINVSSQTGDHLKHSVLVKTPSASTIEEVKTHGMMITTGES